MNAIPKYEFPVQPHEGTGVAGALRALRRAGMILIWTLGCYIALRCVCFSSFFVRSAVRAKKRIALRWVRGMARIIGMKIIIKGKPPEPPFFLVGNHLSWLDFFAGMSILDGRPIAEDPLRRTPVVGPLLASFNPIYVRRRKDDTLRVKSLMADALRNGDSLMLAPETPETTVPLGSAVRMFRAGLIGAAIDADRPVHYASVTYSTPQGCPPPSRVLLFGPNPYYRDVNGNIPESELAAFGGCHSFFKHVMGVLALPWHQVITTFGERPLSAQDHITLANNLQRAVSRIFIPVA